jgi:hypothetical protein
MSDGNVLKRHIKPARLPGVPGDLALAAYFVRDLDGSGGSRPEIGAGTDAALPHLDHDGHLRTVRSGRAEAGGSATQGIRSRERWSRVWSRWSVTGPITRGKNTVKQSANPGNLLKRLVELVGIEPTASSLRTTRSPS